MASRDDTLRPDELLARTTPQFWMNLQVNHDLVACRPARTVRRLQPTK